MNGDYLGEKIVSMCVLAVFMTVPADIRIESIKQRGYDKFGERVCEGGDMYERELEFRKFAASRSIAPIEQWVETITYPIVRVDGTEDYRKTAVKIAQLYEKLSHQNYHPN